MNKSAVRTEYPKLTDEELAQARVYFMFTEIRIQILDNADSLELKSAAPETV